MECRTSPPPPRNRSLKKLPVGEISTPALPTPRAIIHEKKELIASGKFSIGEPCSPYMITKYVVISDGEVNTKQIELHGRKIPLLELRQKLLHRQEKYMKIMTDVEIKSLTKEEIMQMLCLHHTCNPDTQLEALQLQLAALQRTRTLAMWHDHSTVLQQGYILFAVWIVYDPAVFFSEDECKAKPHLSVKNIQEEIEQPMIYMIAPSSSSAQDQLSLIGDRIECLLCVSAQLMQRVLRDSLAK